MYPIYENLSKGQKKMLEWHRNIKPIRRNDVKVGDLLLGGCCEPSVVTKVTKKRIYRKYIDNMDMIIHKKANKEKEKFVVYYYVDPSFSYNYYSDEGYIRRNDALIDIIVSPLILKFEYRWVEGCG